ncbi:hypothetical protein CYMTET_44693 [Cymbomonas tetramitiformis]|uniref:Reverse transcriptase Ty1/copia-type domain-containing protein n=1 Tax=Cymbomonas tetramitiformis TaxID=36881 RepID=A0AAE0C0Y1_9CHLO|nr:hypothetical protein CYMTET_44693 [Cymbomonas tetramitiformis]
MSWDPSMLTPLRSLYDCESLDGNFVSAVVGTTTVILDLRAYVVLKGDEFTGVVKLNSADGGSFWTPVSVFLEARVEHLALLFEYCAQLTVNSFYPLFEKVTVQRSGGGEWEAAVVCATAREDHVLPYQVILERHAGVRGSAIDVGEARVRFETRHVALAAQEEKLTGLPVGVTEPKGWVQLVNGPDSVQWQESDHKEECALIDVKKAILPVETVPAGEKVMRMVAVYKAKLDCAGELTKRKTRWVVCGNGQQHGVHYEDVYAPCTQLSTLRTLIQLSLVLGLLAFALDVITCFLNGELDVDVPLYVSWPNARTVRRVRYGILQKSVYGLKQAPRIWYRTSKEFLLAYDHRIQDCNPCMTPMELRLSRMPVDSEEKLEKLPYVNLVMELMWLAPESGLFIGEADGKVVLTATVIIVATTVIVIGGSTTTLIERLDLREKEEEEIPDFVVHRSATSNSDSQGDVASPWKAAEIEGHQTRRNRAWRKVSNTITTIHNLSANVSFGEVDRKWLRPIFLRRDSLREDGGIELSSMSGDVTAAEAFDLEVEEGGGNAPEPPQSSVHETEDSDLLLSSVMPSDEVAVDAQ